MSHKPTSEQEAIIAAALAGTDNLLIEALAGAAKTSTLVMIAEAIPPRLTLSLAFNKRIAEEMKKRLPSHVECSTLNSLGHRAWGRAIGQHLTLSTGKVHGIVKAEVEKLRGRDKDEAWDRFSDLMKAVDKARLLGWIPDGQFQHAQRLLDNEDLFEVLRDEFIDGFSNTFRELLVSAVCTSINQAYKGVIDFNDQVYMPTLFGANFPRYPLVLCDEAQDFSLLNHAMILKVTNFNPGMKIIAVGDHWQSIYGFRGAATDSMSRLRETFKMKTMPLSISFRCPRSIVELAHFRAPNMTAPEWAIDGTISAHDNKWEATTIKDGAAIICRNNAPLFVTALYLLRNKRGVRVIGADIGPSLIKLLKKIGENCSTKELLLSAIDNWRLRKLEKAKESQVGAINDRAECLRVFASEGNNCDEAVAYAEHVFSSTGTIDLLSGHKSKGLEYDVVYHLDSWRIPSKFAKRAAEAGNTAAMEQELNLRYVITTKAKQELHFINSKEREVYDQDP